MVDTIRRKQLAEHLRHFIAGQMTNDEFEDKGFAIIKGSKDTVLSEIVDTAGCLYDDLHEHRLKGRNAIDKDGRCQIARWIAFLYSDLEYEWPKNKISWRGTFLNLTFYLGVFLAACVFMIFCLAILSVAIKHFHLSFSLWFVVPCFLILMIGAAILVCYAFKAFNKYESNKQQKKMRQYGDPDIWPFIRNEDFEQIKGQPSLLSGES